MKLDLFVKNVPTLLVKVFEINTTNFYRTTAAGGRHRHQPRRPRGERRADARRTTTRRCAAWPRRSSSRELTKPGVYVIDFIGGGKSSRALIRKGRLRPLVAHRHRRADDHASSTRRTSRCTDATVWLGGHGVHAPTRTGAITVPFTAEPGRRPIVISRGDFACLDYHRARPEAYRLAGRHPRRPREPADAAARADARAPGAVPERPAGVAQAARRRAAARSRRSITTASRRRRRCRTSSCSRTASRSTRSACPAGCWTLTIVLSAKVKSLRDRQAGGPGGVARRSRSTRSTGPTRSRTCTSPSSAPTTCIELLGRTGRGEAGPAGAAVVQAPRLQGSRDGDAEDRPARPRAPRAAGGHRQRDRDRPGGHVAHLDALRPTATPTAQSFTRRPARSSRCRTSARAGKPTPRRIRTVRSERQRHPRRQVRRACDPERADRAARPRGRAITTCG